MTRKIKSCFGYYIVSILILVLLLVYVTNIFDWGNEKNTVIEDKKEVTQEEKTIEKDTEREKEVVEEKDTKISKEEKDTTSNDINTTSKHEIKSYQIPSYLNGLKKIKTSEFLVEVGRNKADCMGFVPMKCLQVKKDGGEWEFWYDPIYGIDHKEGDYYLLKVKETQYDFSNPLSVPQNVGSYTWEVIEIVKKYGPDQG